MDPGAGKPLKARQGCRASLLTPCLGFFFFHLHLLPRAQMCFLLLVSILPASQLIPLDWVTRSTALGCFSLNASSCFTPYLLLVYTFSLMGFFSPIMLFPGSVVNTTLIWLPPCPPSLSFSTPTHFYLCFTSLSRKKGTKI